jgi:hypothetical protein
MSWSHASYWANLNEPGKIQKHDTKYFRKCPLKKGLGGMLVWDDDAQHGRQWPVLKILGTAQNLTCYYSFSCKHLSRNCKVYSQIELLDIGLPRIDMKQLKFEGVPQGLLQEPISYEVGEVNKDVIPPHGFWSDPTGIFGICWNPMDSSGHFWQGVPLKSHSGHNFSGPEWTG